MALRKLVESVLVSADQPNPRFVLAVAALVAPVPPEEIERVPEIFVNVVDGILDAGISPIRFVAWRLVKLPPLDSVRLESVAEEDWNADAGFVAAVPRPSPVRALEASALQKLVGWTTALLVPTRTFRVCPKPETTKAPLIINERIYFIVTLVASKPAWFLFGYHSHWVGLQKEDFGHQCHWLVDKWRGFHR